MTIEPQNNTHTIQSILEGNPTEQSVEAILKDFPDSKNTGENFQDILGYLTKNQKFDKLSEFSQKSDCADKNLLPFACNNWKKHFGKQNPIQDAIAASMQNISNANSPNYKKTFHHKDAYGEFIFDEKPGKIMKSSSPLDLAVVGEGKGLKLANDSFTRDGRIRIDDHGRPVTINGNIPLKICYEKDSPLDWSLRSLKINTKGEVFDKNNGKKLGTIESDLGKNTRIAQGYIEESNVNVPMEILELRNNLQALEAYQSATYSEKRLDIEAINITKNL